MTDPRRFVISRVGVAEGDVLVESGPRIGQRYWRVMMVNPARVHDHAWCLPVRGALHADDMVWWLQ